jgi:PTH2 family peptidyl-tRNA hydrolase
MAAPLDRTSPTTAAYVIATAIVAGVTGYFIGQGASLGLFREKQGWPNGYDVKVHKDSSDEEHDGEESEDDESDDEDEGNGEELAAFKDNEEEVKLVLVVRTDLGMTKGMCSTQKKKKKDFKPQRETASNIH